MNIITRKKEIMEVIEKLNEATKLANNALAGLEGFENSIESQKMFKPDAIIVNGVEYVKTDKNPKIGDYVVFEEDVPNRTKKDVPYLYESLDKIRISSEDHLWLYDWVAMYDLDYAVFTKKSPTFTKKSLTRKEVINKAMDYIHTHTEDGYYFTTDERYCKAYFTHDREKRTSTLVLKGYYSGTIHHKETIKCHPNDAYNETIGKAILIARANKDEEMEELFENAPQPTEIKERIYILTF